MAKAAAIPLLLTGCTLSDASPEMKADKAVEMEEGNASMPAAESASMPAKPVVSQKMEAKQEEIGNLSNAGINKNQLDDLLASASTERHYGKGGSKRGLATKASRRYKRKPSPVNRVVHEE